ncbi:hypothetical protein [Winogradskyella sp. UBA3174]|mgnify:CR=1 FL=1|uniref:hypothetical protein n=1 Tax=Winogradskyella sp. UBA3174 TaxID=1947785 RepID=UPI0025E9B553|nr:hypothetical protein [Winogradskyella sp. UBA3174]|tara:strand:+ start:25 stop:282 length:258 start_codon:yes stop_codon:yes gene_type:complete
MKKLILVFICLFAFNAFAQNKSFEISEILIAANSNMPLESTTVYLERPNDITFVTYTISNIERKFELENTTHQDNFDLSTYFFGY